MLSVSRPVTAVVFAVLGLSPTTGAYTPPPAVGAVQQRGTPRSVAPPPAATRRNIPYSEAQALFAELRPELLPPELRDRRASARRAAWPAWVAQRDAEIRGRLVRGYEDSIVNLLFFGTRFTTQPRVRSEDIPPLDGRNEIVEQRLDDLIAAIIAPGTNGRLRFVRTMIDRKAIDPATSAGRRAARAYITDIMSRFIRDRDRYDRAFDAAKRVDDLSAKLFSQATIYRDRGLSSDTSIFADFALERALSEIRSEQLMAAGRVRRVGVVGPGLDFTDKEEGYDFYPQQTIQPFALLDSLVRLGLGSRGAVSTTTFDLNPRITEHLAAARQRARAGESYAVQLARNTNERWMDDLIAYWNRFGSAIGEETAPIAAPPNAGEVQVRAVRFSAAVTLSMEPQDVNIVLQRVEPRGDSGFDLIVATNILMYYDVFEQALALSNIGRMLRPGGLFLTNTTVLSSSTMMMVGYTDTPYTDAGDGDRIWWYQRQ